MSCVQVAVLFDIINRGRNCIDIFFHDFQCNTRGKRKIMKDEKKHLGAVDKSSSEQQFCKSDVITFVV